MSERAIIRAKRYCSVVDCPNSENKNLDVEFYRFPGKKWETERKQRWIAAVKGTNNGKPWKPTDSSRICSAHFVGGKKSDNQNSESYIPTIFPDIYKRKIPSPSRRERLIKRRENTASKFMEIRPEEDPLIDRSVEIESITSSTSIACQTDPYEDDNHEENEKILFCWNGKNDASTQTLITVQKPSTCPKQKIIVNAVEPIITKNKACGPDEELVEGFAGYQNINDDQSMRQLAGVSLSVFEILLGLIEPGKDGQPQYFKKISKSNRLLIFLMKLKLGITFTALGCLFHIHATTISTIFFQILETLTLKTKSWMFWPSKESVKKNLPPAFHNYPNCRCIIDCTEISTDEPPKVEERNLLFSNYKSRYTIKILIVITPDGYICKLSKFYGGRATDSFITNDSGFLELIEPGDLVLADKGFPQIKSELMKREATLVIPPFAMNPQFTEDEVNEGYKIASVRLHVERAIQRIKIFKILEHIPVKLLPYVDAIMHVCCVLTNMQPPLLKSDG